MLYEEGKIKELINNYDNIKFELISFDYLQEEDESTTNDINNFYGNLTVLFKLNKHKISYTYYFKAKEGILNVQICNLSFNDISYFNKSRTNDNSMLTVSVSYQEYYELFGEFPPNYFEIIETIIEYIEERKLKWIKKYISFET